MSSTAIKTMVLPAILTLMAFAVAYQFVDPAPPRQIVISAGQEDGAYYQFARQYQSALREHDIELIIRTSNGSVDNIVNLKNAEAAVGFVQGGTAEDIENSNLLALGSLYYEPLWVFVRQQETVSKLTELSGKRLVIGAQGSGTRALSMRLLQDNQLQDKTTLVDDTDNSLELLKSGQVDAVFMVASAASPTLLRYLEDDAISLMNFERAEAYERRMKYLTHVTLPRGMVDLSRNIPAQEKTLIAAAASLVVRDDLHPAIQDLLLQAAEEVHGNGGWFEQAGEFPTAEYVEYPVSREAKRFYRYGPPFLQRYLSFRLASLIDRLKVMILPLVVLMIPLMKIMPPIYTWRMRSKIYRWYQSLEQIDLANARPNPDIEDLKSKLEEIDQEVIHVSVPLSFASQLYDLRQHIELVKRRLG